LFCQFTAVFPTVAFITNTPSILARAITTARHARFVINRAFLDLAAGAREAFQAVAHTINAITIHTFFAMADWNIAMLPGPTQLTCAFTCTIFGINIARTMSTAI
tara:strand:+ start:479 stop:793 length:315 start_codon:yes stop_codon:yes gene_type:complete